MKDGTYDGTVLIEPKYTTKDPDGTTHEHAFLPYVGKDNFKLIIRGSDVVNAADDALAQGGIGANVLAAFTIRGLMVQMAGLFFSGGAKNESGAIAISAANATSKITVEESNSFAFYGTTGNDSAVIALKDVAYSQISLGEGDDYVSVTYQEASGDDPRYLEGTVNGGAGDDTISAVFDTQKYQGWRR